LVFEKITPPSPKVGKVVALIFGIVIGGVVTWQIRSLMDKEQQRKEAKKRMMEEAAGSA
jgi:hypothetical protein